MLPVCPCRGGTGDSSRSETPKVGSISRAYPPVYIFHLIRAADQATAAKANPPSGSL